MRRIPDHWEIPCWLVGISLSFLIALPILWVAPGWSDPIFETGTLLNVAMAVGVGGLLTYRDHLLSLPIAVLAGTVTTVAWLNVLGVSVGTDVGVSNAVELVFGDFGMSILLVAGMALGCTARCFDERCTWRRTRGAASGH